MIDMFIVFILFRFSCIKLYGTLLGLLPGLPVLSDQTSDLFLVFFDRFFFFLRGDCPGSDGLFQSSINDFLQYESYFMA